MDKLSKALNDFQNWLKGNGNKDSNKENTRRAVLTRFGFIIESDIEIEDHPEFLKKKSDIESRSNEMATKHDKETWTYIAQGFPGSKERPTAQMVGERLKANPDFRSGLLKLQDRHKSEYSALKGELKSAVEDNEIYKQESRSEQVRSMSPEQKRELVGEKSRARYQTEEGKLDRQYRNINHYGRQGERIKTVQRTRYQEDEDFRSKQIERSRARLQKPGIKELGAAEARERTRLRNNPLNEQCDCGCNGNLKSHRANFRKKFWSEYNPVKEGGFKILIAGIDNDAYWSGESWRRCIVSAKAKTHKEIAGTSSGVRQHYYRKEKLCKKCNDHLVKSRKEKSNSWIPEGWKKATHKSGLITGAKDPQGIFHPGPVTVGSNNQQSYKKDLNETGKSTQRVLRRAIQWHNFHTKGVKPPYESGIEKLTHTNAPRHYFPNGHLDEYGLSHPSSYEPGSTRLELKQARFVNREVYKALGEKPCTCCNKKYDQPEKIPFTVTKKDKKTGKPTEATYREGIPGRSTSSSYGGKKKVPLSSHARSPQIESLAYDIYENNEPDGKLRCKAKNCIHEKTGGSRVMSRREAILQHKIPLHTINKNEHGQILNSKGIDVDLRSTIQPEHEECSKEFDRNVLQQMTKEKTRQPNPNGSDGVNIHHPELKKAGEIIKSMTDWEDPYGDFKSFHAKARGSRKSTYTRRYNEVQEKIKNGIEPTTKEKNSFQQHPDEKFALTDKEKIAGSIFRTIKEQVGRIDDLHMSRRESTPIYKSPVPTGKTVKAEDFNYEHLLNRGLIANNNKSAPEYNKDGSIKTLVEGWVSKGIKFKNGEQKASESTNRAKTEAFAATKYHSNLENPKHKALIESRSKLLPHEYATFENIHGRKPYVSELSGHDEVTAHLAHGSSKMEIDHHNPELRDYDEEGMRVDPRTSSQVILDTEHTRNLLQYDRDEKRDEHYKKGLPSDQIRSLMSEHNLTQSKDIKKSNADHFNPTKQEEVFKKWGISKGDPDIAKTLSEPNQRQKRMTERNKKLMTSSWNGFKILDNL